MSNLVIFYASLIMEGDWEFSRVPKRLKEKVKKLLIEKGFEDLTKE